MTYFPCLVLLHTIYWRHVEIKLCPNISLKLSIVLFYHFYHFITWALLKQPENNYLTKNFSIFYAKLVLGVGCFREKTWTSCITDTLEITKLMPMSFPSKVFKSRQCCLYRLINFRIRSAVLGEGYIPKVSLHGKHFANIRETEA